MKHAYISVLVFSLFSTVSAVATTDTNQTGAASQPAMPFAAKDTLQTFTKTVHGGVQHAIAKTPGDAAQIQSIQAYLRQLAGQFSKGDFSETERMHGADMPGLAQLKAAQPDDIKFEYKALPEGAQIHYTTEYPQYIQALHEWFDAQVSAHGNDAIPEHKQHHLAPAE